MVSKKLHRLVRSLQVKKFRKKENLFLVEGEKSVLELLGTNFRIKTLIATAMFLQKHGEAIRSDATYAIEETDAATLSALSSLSTNRDAVALVEIPAEERLSLQPNEWALALVGVNDPGNLGTILRIADWYGLTKIICSPSTTDVYNPKVITASKGSFLRVKTYYTSVATWLRAQNAPAYGADLAGASVHSFRFPPAGILVMGNESHGLSPEVEAELAGKITIPAYGAAESLNVGVATAILCDNLRRAR